MSADNDEEIWAKLRISRSEWEAFGEAAGSVHPTGRPPRSRVLREFMLWYMRRPGAKPPERPPAGSWSAPAALREGE
ncbi:hypothetical protein AB0C77_06720 [Streptomyces sp. NPDC048629]|uniref:hypothetical protein n=1 Tax=Streptomyces sp. NPDC048629 TaxID=3154824 RepID=UPI00341F6BBE